MDYWLSLLLNDLIVQIFDHMLFQVFFGSAFVVFVVSAWSMFLPTNKTKEEKQKSFYPLIVSFFVIFISVPFILKIVNWYDPFYHTIIILTIIIAGIVTLTLYIQLLLNKQKTLDKYL